MKKILIAAGLLAFSLCSFGAKFTVWDKNGAADIFVDAGEPGFLKLAVDDLKSDIFKVGGQKATVVSAAEGGKPALYVGSLTNPAFRKIAERLGVDFKPIEGREECYFIGNVGENSFAILGGGARGAMFGVYEFCSSKLGVDPLYWFSGIEPKKLAELSLSGAAEFSKEPTVKYRGWFINDEDLLTEFYEKEGDRHIEYQFYNQVVSRKLMARVFEALVRCKFNMIIPASFLDIRNPPEAAIVEEAEKRGVFISTHHIEPVGVSGYTFFNYWKAKGVSDAPFSYFSSKEKMEEVWRVYAEEWSKRPNVIWQIGLRGVGDRPMWFADGKIPDSDEFRGKIISEALAKQVEIVKSFDKRPNPPMTMTLWGEGALLYQNGFLKIPEGVIIVFSDNSPGWKMQDDFYKIERRPGVKYGIYYHHQLWGCGPHMAQGVPPSQTMKVVGEAIAKNSAEYVVMNVSNIREFVLGIAASGKMLWDFRPSQDGGLEEVLKERFPGHGAEMAKFYKKYFGSFVMHPERPVPFFLDGNTRGESLSNFNRGRKACASEKALAAFIEADKKPKSKMTEFKRFALVMLGDAYPDRKTPEFRLEFLKKQEANFGAAFGEIADYADSLPERERLFVRTNLLSHCMIMRGLSRAGVFSTKAMMDLSKNDVLSAYQNFAIAREALADVDAAKRINSFGKWADWYRGEKKMDIENLKRLGDEAAAAARKLHSNRK